MTLKSDVWIREQCEKNQLLTPFVTESIKEAEDGTRHVSHGPSSYGYDIRLDNIFKIFSNTNQGSGVIDPLDFDENNYVEHEGDYVIIPPGGFALGVSKERFKMPRNVTALVMNKSTYARCGITVITTVIEAGWEGYLVLEFTNNSPLPAKLYANHGAAQILFFESDEECLVSYADRDGKYQNQEGVQEAIC